MKIYDIYGNFLWISINGIIREIRVKFLKAWAGNPFPYYIQDEVYSKTNAVTVDQIRKSVLEDL